MSNAFHGIRSMEGGEIHPEVMPNDLRDGFDFAASKLPGLSGLNKNIVSLWRFDEPSGVRYDLVGPNHLKENGGTIAQAAGKIGFAALMASASSQWLSVPDNPSLAFTSAMSLSLWIKPTTLIANQTIAAKWGYQTQGGWVFDFHGVTDELRIYIATTLTDAGTTLANTTDADIAAGTYYHLTMVFDGSQTGNANRLKLYVNGVLKTLSFTGTIPATLLTNTADLNFGKWGGSATNYLNGAVDAARLYSRAVTAAEVALLYASGSGIE